MAYEGTLKIEKGMIQLFVNEIEQYCPFRSGKLALHWAVCGPWCPLFVFEPSDKVILYCGSEKLEYEVTLDSGVIIPT